VRCGYSEKKRNGGEIMLSNRREPELSLEPPDEGYLYAECGCEVCRGETLYDVPFGKFIIGVCEGCFKERLDLMSAPEIARKMGVRMTRAGVQDW
jgi:hypothetical protein